MDNCANLSTVQAPNWHSYAVLSRIWIMTDLRVFCVIFLIKNCTCAIFTLFPSLTTHYISHIQGSLNSSNIIPQSVPRKIYVLDFCHKTNDQQLIIWNQPCSILHFESKRQHVISTVRCSIPHPTLIPSIPNPIPLIRHLYDMLFSYLASMRKDVCLVL